MKSGQLVQEWVEKAEEDWLAAETLLRESSAFGSTCFHAHQVVEKYLKVFLIASGKNPPRTHDLLALLEQCTRFDPSMSDLSHAASLLMPHYIEVRYPKWRLPRV